MTKIRAKIENGKLQIIERQEFAALLGRLGNTEVAITIEKDVKQRTLTQNNAIHLYFKLLAEAFQDAGLDARAVFKPEADIPVTADMVKELMWKPVQEMITKKKKTSKLNTEEVSMIYETMNKHLSEKFGIHVPFPSIDSFLIQTEER